MYYRYEVDSENVSKFRYMLSALTIGAIRFPLLLIYILFLSIAIIFGIGADPNKPYSRLRRFIMKSIFSVFCKMLLLGNGYSPFNMFNVKKVRI